MTTIFRALLMVWMFGMVGANVWALTQNDGGMLNAIAAAVCGGVAVYLLVSLVVHP